MHLPPEHPQRFAWLRVVLTAGAGVVVGLTLAAGIVIVIATRLFDYELLTVESGSMSPSIETGDVVFVKPISAKDVQQRDVILFFEKNTRVPVVHRVVAIQRRISQIQDSVTGVILSESIDYNFQTQGDASPSVDETGVGPQDLRGRVWFYIPTFGLISSGVGTEWFLLGFGGLMALGWVAWEFYNHNRQAKAKRRKARRPRGAASGGTESLVKARVLKPRRPSIGRRLVDYSLDRADDALYLGIVALRRTGAAMRATSRQASAVLGLRTATAKGQLASRGKTRARASLALPHGAGLWLLLPVAVWGAALVVMLAGSAAADYGRPNIPGKFSGAGGASSSFVWLPPGTPTPAPTSAAGAPTPCVAPTSALVTALTATATPIADAPVGGGGGSGEVAGPVNTAPPLVTVSGSGHVQVTNPFASINRYGFNPFGFLTPTPKPTRTPTPATPSVPAANTPTPLPPTPTPTPAPQQAPVLGPTPCVQPAAVTATPTTTPTATPTTPTATPTTAASPTASASPSASGTASPSAAPTVTPSPTATSAAPASPTVSATPTPSPTASSTASATASPTATPTATAASTATATPTPTVTPTATATPIVTPTPTPTATP